MNITFDKYAYNPVYWHLKKYLEDEDVRHVLVMGGSSAGKTHSIAQASQEAVIEENVNIKVFRKESSTIKDSVYADFKTISNLINNAHKFFKIFERWITKGENKTVFGGMDDPEKAKGLSSFKYLFFNELSKFSYGDWKEIRRRMRGVKGQTLICDWNPISENHWIKQKVIDKDVWTALPNEIEDCPGISKLDDNSYVHINKKGNTILIKTTYLDNYWVVGHPIAGYGFLDQNTLDEFELSKINDPEDYNVYGLGNWGVVTGKIFKEGKDWEKYNTMPTSWDYKFYGMDLGKNQTNLIEAIIDGDYLYLREVFSAGDLSTSELAELIDREKITNHYIVCDHNEALTIKELKSKGFPIIEAVKGQDSVRFGIKKLKSFKKIRVLNTSIGLVRDFNNYSWKLDSNGDQLGIPDKEKYDPHLIDATRYAVSRFNT